MNSCFASSYEEDRAPVLRIGVSMVPCDSLNDCRTHREFCSQSNEILLLLFTGFLIFLCLCNTFNFVTFYMSTYTENRIQYSSYIKQCIK